MRVAPRCVMLLTAVLVLPVIEADAQTTDPRRYVGFKAGVNNEHAEDNLNGTTFGAGFSLGLPLASDWLTEIELWIPTYLQKGGPESNSKHRDILVNVGMIRPFGTGTVQPFVVVGGAYARTQDRLTLCTALRPSFDGGGLATTVVACNEPDVTDRRQERFDSHSLMFLGGGGMKIQLTRRLMIVPELRVNGFVTVLIVRPSIGALITF